MTLSLPITRWSPGPLAVFCLLLSFAAPLRGATAAARPRPSLSPRTVKAGESVTARGSRFNAGSAIRVIWKGDGSALGSAAADVHGGFDLAITAPGVPAGEYAVQAVDGKRAVGEATMRIRAMPTAAPTDAPEPAATDAPTKAPEPTGADAPTKAPEPTEADAPTEKPSATDAPAEPTATSTPAHRPKKRRKTATTTATVEDAEHVPFLAAASGSPLPLAPVADAGVSGTNPTANYGGSTVLRVDGDPQRQTYLRFDLSAVSGPIGRTVLRVYATDGTASGPTVYSSSGSWSERTITWSNRPGPTGSMLASAGAIGTGVWVDFDVTRQVAAGAAASFVLTPNSTDGVSFASRESGNAATRPWLVITQDQPGAASAATATAVPTATMPAATATVPTATPTSVPTATPTSVPTATPTAISTATPTTTDPAVTVTVTGVATLAPSPTGTPSPQPSTTSTSTPTATPTAIATPSSVPTATATVPPGGGGGAASLVLVGDIMDDVPGSAQSANAVRNCAALAAEGLPFVALGDAQYDNGDAVLFRSQYGASRCGAVRAATDAVAGNHEYQTAGAAGYYGYFGDRASPGQPGCAAHCRGYYALAVAGTDWRLIALNANCGELAADYPGDGCAAGTAQERWLRAQLADARAAIPHATLCRRTRDGEIASVTAGRRRFIPAAELDRFVGADGTSGREPG